MAMHRILDWDDAYANFPNVPGGDRWPGLWVEPAQTFRDELTAQGRAEIDLAYGPKERNRFDLFLPEGAPRGLVVFIHGGYWMRFDKSLSSHLARGALTYGHAVAMPSYTLCPDVRISAIVAEVGAAIEAAARIGGPIRLAGHSAGGHLATQMVSTATPLAPAVQGRIVNTVSIAGVHDLRPLLRTALNQTLKLDEAEAASQSPAVLAPLPGTRLTCWVGQAERSEFVRQSALLANVWTGLGATTELVVEPDRHHFTIIDGLTDPAHPLTRALFAD